MALLNVLKDKDGNILDPYIPRYEELVRRIRYGVKNVTFSDRGAYLFTMDELQSLFNLKSSKSSDFVVFQTTVEANGNEKNNLILANRIDDRGSATSSGGIRMILRDPVQQNPVKVTYSILYVGDITNMNP